MAHRVTPPRRQLGMSLVELLVSMAIGLILMVAVLSAYVGSSGAARMAEAQSRMNEDAQAALNILAQQLRMAGDNPIQPNYDTATPRNPAFSATSFSIRGCEGNNFSNVTSASSIAALTCTAGGTGADSIAVAYEADVYNTVKNGVNPTDCLGQTLPTTTVANSVKVWNTTTLVSTTTTVSFHLADNRFYVGTGGAITVPSLYCRGNGGTAAQPLVENIEDMQITYGTSPTTTTTLYVGGYLSAAEILSNTDLAALPDDATRWSKVVTARICVVARSEQPVVADSVSARYLQCDGTLNTSPPDLRLRRAYTTTVVLRNRVPAS